MTRETTYKGVMGDLERLIAALFANGGELGHLDGARLRMEELLESVRETAQEQAELIAAKQEASRRLLLQIGHGARTATAVRKMLKAHYGLGEARRVRHPAVPRPHPPRRPGPFARARPDDPARRDRPALRIHRR